MNHEFTMILSVLAGTFVLRTGGVLVADRFDENSAAFRWIGCVAFAIAAGLMSKIIVLPSGGLAQVPGLARYGGILAGVAVFYFSGRRVFAGLFGGIAAFGILSVLLT